MKKRFSASSLTLGSAAIGALLFNSAAWADSASTSVNSVNPGQIEVTSDGSSYKAPKIPLVSLNANVNVRIDTHAAGRVASWSTWIGVTPQSGPGKATFSQHKTSQSYPSGDRPRTVNRNVVVTVPYGTIGPYVVSLCNAQADKLRQQGKSNTEIFSQDRSIQVSVSAGLEADTTGAGSGNVIVEVGNSKTFDIVCKSYAQNTPAAKAEPTPYIPAMAYMPATLEQVAMVVDHPTGTVQCPVEVTARMTFKADADDNDTGQPISPGYVRYKVNSASGKSSKVESVFFASADRNGGHYYKTVEQKFMVGENTSAAGPGSQGAGSPGGVVAETAKGFAAPTAPSAPNVHKDSLWVEVVEARNGSVKKSSFAQYQVTCKVMADVSKGAVGQMTGATKATHSDPTKNAPQKSPGKNN